MADEPDYDDLKGYFDASLEDRFSALAHESNRRIPVIRGYAVLIKQWMESEETKAFPEIVFSGLNEIIQQSDELWRVLKIMTKHPE